MTKHFARPQFPPRPTKGTLVAAAKKQVKADEAKALTNEDAAAKAKADEALATDPTSVDVSTLPVNDPAAGEVASVTEPPAAPAPAAESPNPLIAIRDALSAAPAPAPAAEQPKEVKPPKGTNDGLYALGKRYSPKTERNGETWGKLCKALADGPKTMKELAEAIKGHGDFLGYMTRGGHIVPHKVEEKVSG